MLEKNNRKFESKVKYDKPVFENVILIIAIGLFFSQSFISIMFLIIRFYYSK